MNRFIGKSALFHKIKELGGKRRLNSVLVASLSLSLMACTSSGSAQKPLLFGPDCEKIASRVQQTSEIMSSIYYDSTSGEQARSRIRSILKYYRSYEQAHKFSITRDQKLFLASLKKDDKFLLDWIDWYMIEPVIGYPTSLQYEALSLMSDQKERESKVPCSTLTYKEYTDLPVNQPIP